MENEAIHTNNMIKEDQTMVDNKKDSKKDDVLRSVKVFMMVLKGYFGITIFYFFLGMVSSYALSNGKKLPYLPLVVSLFVFIIVYPFFNALFTVLCGIYVNTKK